MVPASARKALPTQQKALEELAGLANTNGYVQQHFFARSARAVAAIDELNKWMGKVKNPTSAEWAKAANDMGMRLDSLVSIPNNLGSGGQWPEGRAQFTGDAAATGNLGYHSAAVGANTSRGDGQGADLNRFGWG